MGKSGVSDSKAISAQKSVSAPRAEAASPVIPSVSANCSVGTSPSPAAALAATPALSTENGNGAAASIALPDKAISCPRNFDEPEIWHITINAIGAFERFDVEGTFRITAGDTVLFDVPAGSLVNQADVKLEIRLLDADKPAVLTSVPDALGSRRFEWTCPPSIGGVAECSFLYLPFQESDETAAAIVEPIPANTTASKRLDSSKNIHVIVEEEQAAEKLCCPTVEADGKLWKRSIVNRIVVDPQLRIAGKRIPPTGLIMQTIMARSLGTIDTWLEGLRVPTASVKYNALHFTPLQLPGQSGSCYSLKDALSISPDLLPASMKSYPAPVQREEGWKLLKETVSRIETELGMLSTSDVVLNHCACDSPWIRDHPESGYSVANSPHLRAAVELDIALQIFSKDIVKGRFSADGLTAHICDEFSLSVLRQKLQDNLLRRLDLHEYFTIDMERALRNFYETPVNPDEEAPPSPGAVGGMAAQDEFNQACLEMVGISRNNGICPSGILSRRLCSDEGELRVMLHSAQEFLAVKCAETCAKILDSVEGCVRWERVQCRKGPIGLSHWEALVPRYFTPIRTTDNREVHLANNGWVMNWDAEKDFAAPGTLVYLDRSLVAWSDCIKLRFGRCRDDSPFLWDLMTEYCERTAATFHGIRLDNCHSTPIAVAQHCLQAARRVNPSIWIYAELFTGRRSMDLKFERELGLNALIRESMQCSSPRDLAWHITEYGGSRLGSLDTRKALRRGDTPRPLRPRRPPSLFYDCTHDNETPHQRRTAVDALSNAAAVCASVCATGSVRGYDELIPKLLSIVSERRLYHPLNDSEESVVGATTIEKQPSQRDGAIVIRTKLFPTSHSVSVRGDWDGWKSDLPLAPSDDDTWVVTLPDSCVTFAQHTQQLEYKFIADGCQWFFDPAQPQCRDSKGNINNVLVIKGTEAPSYEPPTILDSARWQPGMTLPGILPARAVLNEFHLRLALENFTEVAVDSPHDTVIIVTRHCPATHQRAYFVIHTAFTLGGAHNGAAPPFTFEFRERIEEIVLEAQLEIPPSMSFYDEPEYINGFPSRLRFAANRMVPANSNDVDSSLGLFKGYFDEGTNCTRVRVAGLRPGGVFIFLTGQCLEQVRKTVAQAIAELPTALAHPRTRTSRAEELQALSYLLFSCNSEELDRSKGARGSYALEQIGPLPYAGVAGVIPLFDDLRRHAFDDKFYAHPLFRNILAGNWLPEYLADRLDSDSDDTFSGGVQVLLLRAASWLREVLAPVLKKLDRRLIPYYVDWVLSSLYAYACKRVAAGLPTPLRLAAERDNFVMQLATATLQVYSYVPSSPLVHGTRQPSLSAGLPHFSVDYMRAWGRDTFIALRGTLLVPGRFLEAKNEILGYARVVRHALIPNLLDSGNNPRYNARDATWWFLQAIQDYCGMVPEDGAADLLQSTVDFKYPEYLPKDKSSVQTIADLIHYILSSHASGIHFREVNAGPQIDAHMVDPGFDITIRCDPLTGFLFGGNRHNCGTWMDKMGSSIEAKNKGVPATPRDGAAVELVGLLKSTLRFVNSLPRNLFPYQWAIDQKLSYLEWEKLIQTWFDQAFYIPETRGKRLVATETQEHTFIEEKWINRAGIYKDSVGQCDPWRDYQLRPNFFTALAVAPELSVDTHADTALTLAGQVLFNLRGPKCLERRIQTAAKDIATTDAIAIERRLTLMYAGVKGVYFTAQLGPKTLDPKDYNFRPQYNNDDRSTDFTVAHGFNYHNGPEWVWPLGHYLEAVFRSKVSGQQNCCNDAGAASTKCLKLAEAQFECMRLLFRHRHYINKDPWLSLPELTNQDAEPCPFSCMAQAWSIGTILGFFHCVVTHAVLHDTAEDKTASGASDTAAATPQPSHRDPLAA